MYTGILVPIDGSEFSDKAVKEAAVLAKALRAKIVLFHAAAVHLPPLVEGTSAETRAEEREMAKKEAEEWAKVLLAAAARKAGLSGGESEQHFALGNSPHEAIVVAARKFDCNLIVMASHGRRGMSAMLLGSETHKVLAHSSTPVLVVR